MASQSHYEINVSLNGRHLFATAERSLITSADYASALKIFHEKFPKAEGYEVRGTYWQTQGYKVDENGHFQTPTRRR